MPLCLDLEVAALKEPYFEKENSNLRDPWNIQVRHGMELNLGAHKVM